MTTKADRKAIYERDGGLCGFCGEAVDPFDFDLDHFPLPKGLYGPTVPANLRVAHPVCNRRNSAEVRRAIRRSHSDQGIIPGAEHGERVARTMKIPISLWNKIVALAQLNDRSINGEVVRLLRVGLEETRKDVSL